MSNVSEKRDFEPGDVVIADIPYRQKPGSKARPTVVISSQCHNSVRQDLVVVEISGKPVAGPWDIRIEEWREAGLRKQSKVVCDSISTVFQGRLKPIGRIDPEILDELKARIALILELRKDCDELNG